MSKKYVPSFLKQGEPPAIASGTATTASFDAFPMNKKQKEKGTATFDAFPMNKRGGSGVTEFDAFSKVKKLPDVEAFSSFHSTRTFGSAGTEGADPYSAFGSKTRGTEEGETHGFPMSKRSAEDRPSRREESRGVRNPHLVFEPMTYGGAILSAPAVAPSKKAATVVVVSGVKDDAKEVEEDSSFAAKFATRMKIVEDPSYVPPPTVVDMESEQDFPTLGMAPVKARTQVQVQGWTQTIQAATIATVSAHPVADSTIQKKKKRVAKVQVEGQENKQVQKKAPVVLRRIRKTQDESKEGEFTPIDYEEDAFDDGDVVDTSDMDEDAFFADEDDEDDDELDPTVYENRRPEDIY